WVWPIKNQSVNAGKPGFFSSWQGWLRFSRDGSKLAKNDMFMEIKIMGNQVIFRVKKWALKMRRQPMTVGG
ncbi:MAG TPA: hypothetical protein VFX58_09590, partial [Chitinophagaceae bacterium]|nr:hypothetical protein [Chitinophagaceae bacterium]